MSSIPVLYIQATNNYDVGKAIGSTFKGWIGEYMDSANDVRAFRQWYNTVKGKQIYDGYVITSKQYFPDIVAEVQGMADGSGQKFEDVFMLQIASEILFCHIDEANGGQSEKSNIDKGCTDVLVNNKEIRMIGHNDDWDEDVDKRVYMVHVTITRTGNTSSSGTTSDSGTKSVKEQFVSFAYPGYLAGFCFGMNKDLVITLNTVCPRQANQGSVPLLILLRSLLGCESVEACARRMENNPAGCAFGMNINVAVIDSTDMVSIEVYPHESGTKVHVHPVPYDVSFQESCFFHQNHYNHLSDTEESGTQIGTKRREKRIKEMDVPKSADDVRRILGDTADKIEPIYRTLNESHYAEDVKTCATALFNISQRTLEVYRGNPMVCQPCLKLPFL